MPAKAAQEMKLIIKGHSKRHSALESIYYKGQGETERRQQRSSKGLNGSGVGHVEHEAHFTHVGEGVETLLVRGLRLQRRPVVPLLYQINEVG